jgi:hypothetical protein
MRSQGYILYPAIASVAATLLLPDDTNKDISARWREPIQDGCGGSQPALFAP